MHNIADNKWVNVENAARILGVSKQAIRQRIYRGTIPHTKAENGTVYVRITAHNDEVHGESHDVDNAVLLDYVETLKDRITHLEEESVRKDHIIMSLTQRIPELEAPSETREAPVAGSEESSSTQVPLEREEEPFRERSWWRRFFGFE